MNTTTEDDAIKHIACPTCKQPAGELCVTLVSRKPVLLVHDARAAVLRRAWWAGYAEGCKQGKAAHRRRPHNPNPGNNAEQEGDQ